MTVPEQPVPAFVSWAQRDEEWTQQQAEAWRGQVYAFTALIRAAGIDAELDLLHLHEPIDWTRFGETQIRQNDQLLIVVNKTWRERWEGRNSPSVGPGSVAEANALRSIFARNQDDFLRRVKLVLLPDVDQEAIPDGMHGIPRFVVPELTPAGVADIVDALKQRPRFPPPPVGQPNAFPPRAPVSAPPGPLDTWDAERLGLIATEIAVLEQALSSLDVSADPGSGRGAAWSDVRARLDTLEAERKSLTPAPPSKGTAAKRSRQGARNPRWLTTIELPRSVKHPTGVAVDGETIYVVDHDRGEVLRLQNGRVTASVSGLSVPHHAAVHDGLVLVSDTGNNRLRLYDSDLNLKWSRAKFTRALKRPHGVVWLSGNEFYVANTDAQSVMHIQERRLTGQVGSTEGGAEPDRFAFPCGIACTHNAVVVADTFHNRVQVYSPDLKFQSSFGQFGHNGGQFASPVGVACWQDHVVVADQHNQRLQLWQRTTSGGAISFACVTSDLCKGSTPFGVAFSTYGELYVADRKHGRLLKIDFADLLNEQLGG